VRRQDAIRHARRLWPYLLLAWRRWESLPEHRKQRLKAQARGYAERGKRLAQRRRPGGSKGAG
jgi:hypothetical protein